MLFQEDIYSSIFKETISFSMKTIHCAFSKLQNFKMAEVYLTI